MTIRISRVLHAGYVFECDGTQIFFDPIFENPFSVNCYAFPEVEFKYDEIENLKPSAVFISHYHDDHFSFDSLKLLNRDTPIYIYCIFEELVQMIRELGFQKVHPLSLNQPIALAPFEIIPLKALDANVDSIFHIKVKKLNILNVVDSWIDPVTFAQLKKTAPWDLVLWPFQTMGEIEVLSPTRAQPASLELPVEWTEQILELNPRYIVPSSCQFIFESWSWYNQLYFPISYKSFQQQIGKILPDTKVLRLDPGASIELGNSDAKASASLSWVQRTSHDLVDYEYNPQIRPPSTASISQNFPELSKEKIERVHRFCLEEIIKMHARLEEPQDKYFQKPRSWKLSIYDHLGQAKSFFYKIDGEHLELDAESGKVISWLTEIPLFKFYAALENGEQLNSLYVRINDMNFGEKLEKELKDADIMEDPLIRCLFNGVVGGYQTAQLERIKNRTTAL